MEMYFATDYGQRATDYPNYNTLLFIKGCTFGSNKKNFFGAKQPFFFCPHLKKYLAEIVFVSLE